MSSANYRSDNKVSSNMEFSISHVPLTLRHTGIFLGLERAQYNFRGFHEQVLVRNLTVS